MSVLIRQEPDLVPLCPHCEREIAEVLAVEPTVRGAGAFTFGKRTLYACGACRKVLSVSHRKGFWAG